MTATLINGYSSGLFYLLYRIVPHLMKIDNKDYDNPGSFNGEYGVTEATYELEESEFNANSKSRRKKLHERQKPGVSPLVYSRFLIDCAVFLSLNDMGKHLPDYEEIPVELNLSPEIEEEYKRIENSYRSCMNRRDGTSRKLMSSFLSLLPHIRISHMTLSRYIIQRVMKRWLFQSHFQTLMNSTKKDVATLDIVKRKVAGGERVLIYTSWVKIDTQDKLKKLLEEQGYKVALLEQKVSPEKREEWVSKKVEAGIDVLITNPSLVETGLDLNAFTTLIYYNIGYNLFTFRQSSRRSWRINQTAPRIEVYILYYKGVMQARAIRLMASKLAAATLVEGNFSDEGLAAMSDCTDMTSLARKRDFTKGIRDEVEDVGAMFKKMAIIKDTSVPEENEEDYIITDDVTEETKPVTTTKVEAVKILSVSEKLQKAMLLAKQATSSKTKLSFPVTNNEDVPVGTQFTLFDVA